MKKVFVFCLAIAILLSLPACGSSASIPDEPGEAVYRADVQAYITDMIDANAAISNFEIISSSMEEENLDAACHVLFESSDEQYQADFSLTYSLRNGAWELTKCSAGTVEEIEPEEAAESEETDEAAEIEEIKESEAVDVKKVNTAMEMSDNLYDFTFMLDGVVYQLPFAYTDLTDNGWEIYSPDYSFSFSLIADLSEDSELSANTYGLMQMSKDGNIITIDVINMSGNVKQARECKVGGIEVHQRNLSDIDVFSIAQGINTASTSEDIIEAFGPANSTDTYDEYTSLAYYQDGYYISADFTCYDEDMSGNSISMRNFISEEDDITETNTDVPSYLSEYVAPTELGDDITSCIIEIAGDLYRLPAPVTAFTGNGWTVTSRPDSVSAGRIEYIELEKDGYNLSVGVKNFAEYQTTPENCAVFSISEWDSSIDSADLGLENIPLVLPGSITWSSTTKSEVENIVTNSFDYSESQDFYDYYYYDDYTEASIRIEVSMETETVYSIYVSHELWDYR